MIWMKFAAYLNYPTYAGSTMTNEKDTLKSQSSERESVTPLAELSDGGMLAVIHQVDCEDEIGVIRPVQEGHTLNDSIRMLERDEHGLYLSPSIGELKKGPSKVVNEKYRSGWDQIWKKSDKSTMN